jgi:tRNA-splicing ligase RtcB
MDPGNFSCADVCTWRMEPRGGMRVPAIIYADEMLLRDMDEKVRSQLQNVATLPGIVDAAYAMPDAHWGYGFPIGGVAAFDPEAGGVVSGGGVGFDISCGVRTLHTGLTAPEILPFKERLADALCDAIPAGLGSTGRLKLSVRELDTLLVQGAAWAVAQGYGNEEDLLRTEEHGCMADADPSQVSERAKKRQLHEMGTLGSGNHYLEVQHVEAIQDPDTAAAFGIRPGDIKLSIHCGSRGLGHQIGTEYLRKMAVAAPSFGIRLPDRELACAPIRSPLGTRYLAAMRAAVNCALANRQILTHLARGVFRRFFPHADLRLLYDVSHNTCKEEVHTLDGQPRTLFVHRKGATRAFGPGHPSLPADLRAAGQPVLIGGTMGTASYILAGTSKGMSLAFGSACHGAGRSMSRRQALRHFEGSAIRDELRGRGILVRSPSTRGIAEEAPSAYKDVSRVVAAAEEAGLARCVARLAPLICIKG